MTNIADMKLLGPIVGAKVVNVIDVAGDEGEPAIRIEFDNGRTLTIPAIQWHLS